MRNTSSKRTVFKRLQYGQEYAMVSLHSVFALFTLLSVILSLSAGCHASLRSASRPILTLSLSSSLCLLEQIRYHSRPTSLMAGTDAAPAITVKVLVEWDVTMPVRIILKGRVGTKYWSATLFVTQKDARKPSRKFICDLSQR